MVPQIPFIFKQARSPNKLTLVPSYPHLTIEWMTQQ